MCINLYNNKNETKGLNNTSIVIKHEKLMTNWICRTIIDDNNNNNL
jgi:hypothetical protein